MIGSTDRDNRVLALLGSANPVRTEDVRAELGEEELTIARDRVLATLADGRESAGWRAPGAGQRRRLLPRGRRATTAILIGVLLLAAAAAGAATGILPVGSVFRGEGFQEGSTEVDETVVATGTAPVSGAWQMTVFETEPAGAGSLKTQVRGVRCLKVELLESADDRPGAAASGYCGHIPAFEAFSYGRKPDAQERGEVLLFGRAPENAGVVELTADGGVRITTETQEGPANVAGDFWLIAAPPGLRNARLTWIDQDGRARQPWLDASFQFQGPTERTVVATGTAPVAGPWQMTLHESRRRVADGDLYEPEGLPCIFLKLLAPPEDTAVDGGYCGVQRKTPGFTRGQRTVPAVLGAQVREILVYGRAPEEADNVEISADGGMSLAVKTQEGPANAPGDFWLIATPPGLKNGRVYWIDEDGGARGPGVALLPP
jgi:hypothetical protein